jgi:hypothetical protein
LPGQRTLRCVADIGQRRDILDKHLRELVDAIVHQHIAGAGDCSGTKCHFIDRCAYDVRHSFRQHSGNSCRRGDLSGQTLHKNCPHHRRLYTVGETIDGFSFQTRPTAHARAFGV